MCTDFAALLQSYGVYVATADRFAGEFPTEQMGKHTIMVNPCERSKSEIYREFLPRLNSGSVELLDLPRLHTQLTGLERRTARGGRDRIDHVPGGHDDVANAACGALVEVFLPVARAYGVGQALTADRPVVVRTLEEAERELTRRRSNRTSYQGRDRHTSAQQALDRIHDEQSQLGCVRRVCWPVRESDAEGSDVLTDWDPFR